MSFSDVLMLADGVGREARRGSRVVSGEIVEQRKGDKVKVFKKTRRSTYRRKNGHRQHESVIKITGISVDGKTAPEESRRQETESRGWRSRRRASVRTASHGPQKSRRLLAQRS